jgi:hypothetical protein
MLAVHCPVVNGAMTWEILCLVGMPAWRLSKSPLVGETTSRTLVFVSGIFTALRRLGCGVLVVRFQKIRHQSEVIFQTANGCDQGEHQATAKPYK